jgi:hypothetical protein
VHIPCIFVNIYSIFSHASKNIFSVLMIMSTEKRGKDYSRERERKNKRNKPRSPARQVFPLLSFHQHQQKNGCATKTHLVCSFNMGGMDM